MLHKLWLSASRSFFCTMHSSSGIWCVLMSLMILMDLNWNRNSYVVLCRMKKRSNYSLLQNLNLCMSSIRGKISPDANFSWKLDTQNLKTEEINHYDIGKTAKGTLARAGTSSLAKHISTSEKNCSKNIDKSYIFVK